MERCVPSNTNMILQAFSAMEKAWKGCSMLFRDQSKNCETVYLAKLSCFQKAPCTEIIVDGTSINAYLDHVTMRN